VRPKIKIILLGLASIITIPGILAIQAWEERSSKEWTASRIAVLEAFENKEYASALPGLALMAEQESAMAQARLAFLYEHGFAVERDVETAMRLYDTAAENGYSNAKLALARLLDEGEDGFQDRSRAAVLYEELALAGSSKAALRLAALHFSGAGRIRQDYVAAARWLGRAAGDGHPEAQLRMGLLYRDGIGVAQDIVLAHMWLNLAAARFPAAERLRREKAVAARDALVPRMSADELRESLQIAREWQSTNS